MSAINICCLQHVPFEQPGPIAGWALSRGHRFTTVRLYGSDSLPKAGELDWLVVMGGPMSVYDEREYPWLLPEKSLIERCVASGKYVIGICLGSQLLAQVLGARVCRNRVKEIGWFPVEQQAPEDANHRFANLPRRFTPFHWHGETYGLPPGTVLLASSEGCTVQAFEHPSALGLQFHLEMTPAGASDLIRECSADIGSGPYEQGPEEILSRADCFATSRELLVRLLDRISATNHSGTAGAAHRLPG